MLQLPLQNTENLQELFGTLNEHAKIIEKNLHVRLRITTQGLGIEGEDPYKIELVSMLLRRLLTLQEHGSKLNGQMIRYLCQELLNGEYDKVRNYQPDRILLTHRGKPVESKTEGQRLYLKAIEKHEVTFVNGPAGTGKTYLAVAMAVKAFKAQEVERIILTRPAVEAGEKLGFLPGDLQMKVDPYMRPLYDALYEFMGPDQYLKLMEKGSIEVSPLAYMRGRTLDHAFIILDEAQNTSPEQMKMFLTRMGTGSKSVITGDLTQRDLSDHQKSGLQEVQSILRNIEEIAFVQLKMDDIVRNCVVQKIVNAYEKYHQIKEGTRGTRNENTKN